MNGTYTLLDEFDNYNYVFFNNMESLSPAKVLSGGKAYWESVGQTSMDMYKTYGAPTNKFLIPGELATSWDACNNLWKEFSTQFILGKVNESNWNDFVSQWYSYGGDKVTEYAAKVIK